MLIAGESGSDPIVAVIGVIVDSSGIHETQLTPVSWLLNRVEGPSGFRDQEPNLCTLNPADRVGGQGQQSHCCLQVHCLSGLA